LIFLRDIVRVITLSSGRLY